jgi:DNA adenine methylase
MNNEKYGGANTLFARMGGKKNLALRIIKMIPEDYKTFVEPFVGAGNIFFRLDQYEGKKYVINDKDESVIKIFKGVASNPDAFIQTKPLTKAEFDNIKSKSNKTAVEEYKLLKYSFFSTGKSYNDSDNLKRITNVKYQKNHLEECSKLLKNATILNQNFNIVINKYNKPDTFFYLDPPYESEKETDYKDYVTPEQVYDAVKKIKGRFLLSYNSSPKINSLFKEFNIKKINTLYSNTGNIDHKQKEELLISNFSL